MGMKNEVGLAVAWEKVQKLRSIAENVEKKYGRVSAALAQELASAEADCAVAKDNWHDPYMSED
jgi:hypothetical protein